MTSLNAESCEKTKKRKTDEKKINTKTTDFLPFWNKVMDSYSVTRVIRIGLTLTLTGQIKTSPKTRQGRKTIKSILLT